MRLVVPVGSVLAGSAVADNAGAVRVGGAVTQSLPILQPRVSVTEVRCGADRFYCKPYSAVLMAVSCVTRQEQVRQEPKRLELGKCKQCPDGEIVARLSNVDREAIAEDVAQQVAQKHRRFNPAVRGLVSNAPGPNATLSQTGRQKSKPVDKTADSVERPATPPPAVVTPEPPPLTGPTSGKPEELAPPLSATSEKPAGIPAPLALPRPIDLTDRQADILQFIGDQIAGGLPPTIRDIADRFAMASTNGPHEHLVALERKGYIARDAAKSRGIRILKGHPAAGMLAEGRIQSGPRRTSEYVKLIFAEVCEALELVEAIGWDKAREYAAAARAGGTNS